MKAWGFAKGAKSPDLGPLGAWLHICSLGAGGKGEARAPAARRVVRIIMVDCILDSSGGFFRYASCKVENTIQRVNERGCL